MVSQQQHWNAKAVAVQHLERELGDAAQGRRRRDPRAASPLGRRVGLDHRRRLGVSDWVARAGSFVYEPPGHIHTLYVHPSEGRMLTLFHVQGPLVYLDENNNVIEYSDAFTELEKYKRHCLEQDLGEEWLRSLIR